MPQRIAQLFGLVFVWHAIRHFSSYALLGSQSSFENPWYEWLALGILQLLAGALLLFKPRPWSMVTAAVIFFLWGMAYPLVLHVGDSAFLLLLLGLAAVQLGGDAWIPLATAPAIIGMTLAGAWKLHYGNFSLCNLTNCVILRYPWVDVINLGLNKYEGFTSFMSYLVIGIELSAPLIWILLFFPRLWLVRSILTLLPISLLFGIGITGNLDEFAWIMLLPLLLMLGPKQPQKKTPNRVFLYTLATVLCLVELLNIESNVRRICTSGPDPFFDSASDLPPSDRFVHMAKFIIAPVWNMYSSPIVHGELFAGETSRILKLEPRIKAENGCGLELDRWERIYWERVRQGLEDTEQKDMAIAIRTKYKALEGKPCSIIVFPSPTYQQLHPNAGA